MTEPTQFEEWAIVEIMGHQRYAGLVTEEAIGGASFVRIDVPEVDDLPKFTKMFGHASIFCITPVTKEIALEAVKRFRSKPITVAGYSQARLPYSDVEDEYEGF